MRWYHITTRYRPQPKFGNGNRYRDGKNGVETSLVLKATSTQQEKCSY